MRGPRRSTTSAASRASSTSFAFPRRARRSSQREGGTRIHASYDRGLLSLDSYAFGDSIDSSR